ncbi:hypothetical protein NUW58_g248 [Xylaria curta]|uniref:Uncharacterized protein n=1 Tax=Xylaria curta TaxID=42375 RepID=A0ACC1PPY2_9PEZI|nr:hypothetical protein NUW58_g248 [Xylaria curta]
MSHSSRFIELRQLVFGLTPEETRYLGFLISDFHTDIIGELPLELLVLIVPQLELEDFARCLRVSKIWRRRFLSESVTLAYARCRWPAMDRYDFLATLSRFGWASYSFRQPLQDVDLELVSWDSKAHYKLDPAYHTGANDLPYDYTQYSMNPYTWDSFSKFYDSGKVAWHPCRCVVVVDDLRSKTRKVFTPPSGMMHGSVLELQSLGPRLVIGTIDRLLIAWDHVGNQAYEKLLPCRSLRCTTQGDRVAAVLYGGDVVVWSPGHALIRLDTSRLKPNVDISPSEARTWEACLDVFFDPRDSKSLYLASGHFLATDSGRMVHVTVHQFSGERHVASWSSEYQDPAGYVNQLQFEFPVPEPRIVMAEYEFDHSYIVFRRKISIGYPHLTTFDKKNRKFVDLEPRLLWPQRLKHSRPGMGAGIDLDFMVRFKPAGYEVVRSKLPLKHDHRSRSSNTD